MSAHPAKGHVWTEAEIRAFGVRLPGVVACSIVYDDGRTKANERLRTGDVDFPVLRRGRKYIVPTQAVLALLGLATTAANGSAADDDASATGVHRSASPNVSALADRRDGRGRNAVA